MKLHEKLFAEGDDYLIQERVTMAFEKYREGLRRLNEAYGEGSEESAYCFMQKQTELLKIADRAISSAHAPVEVDFPLKVYEKILSFHLPSSSFFEPKTKIKILNKIACCLRRLQRVDDGIVEVNKAIKLCNLYNLNGGESYSNLAVFLSEKGLHNKAFSTSEQAII